MQQLPCPTSGLPAPPQHDCLADLMTYVWRQADRLRGYPDGILVRCSSCPEGLAEEGGQGQC